MHKHILNIAAVCERVKQNLIPNLYHRVNNAMKGADFTLTVPVVEELEEIIISEHKKNVKFLKDLKKKIQDRQNEAA